MRMLTCMEVVPTKSTRLERHHFATWTGEMKSTLVTTAVTRPCRVNGSADESRLVHQAEE